MKMPEVRISLIVHIKLQTNGVNADWYIVIALCPLFHYYFCLIVGI